MARKNNIFTQVPVNRPKTNLFDLSHEVKMSGKFGYLYPILIKETLPGDTFRDEANIMCRFAPMLAPIMHRIDVTTHFFFVPNRLLWDNWQEFITGGQDGEDVPFPPYLRPDLIYDATPGNEAYMQKGTLWDYLGLPVFEGAVPGTFSQDRISVLPFRAYAKVWNDFYRDPNFDTEIILSTELNGNVSAQSRVAGVLDIRWRGWEKDYYTSALPWTQRGAEVLIPIQGSGIVTVGDLGYVDVNSTAANGDLNIQNVGLEKRLKDSAGNDISEITGLVSDLDNVETTINDLRRAYALQRWLEVNARGGYRYVEQIQGHFNVRVPDYRLQRAEYLGGGKQPVVISQVLSTADTDDVPVGEMAGHGISVGKSNRFSYFCQEHGFVIGVMSVMPRTAYQQGLDKMWFREDKFDFAFPELANIGEQPILSKEVMFSFDHADDDENNETFGYTPRYSEYKFQNDRVAGDFRDTLAFWHLGRIFTERPALDAEFTTLIENQSNEEPVNRIFAVQDGTDYLWFQIYHRLTVKRPLPYFGVPGGL